MAKKTIQVLCTAFRDGFQSVYGSRVLPKDYYFFSAGDDNTNWFRKEYESTEIWNWELENPYQNFEE